MISKIAATQPFAGAPAAVPAVPTDAGPASAQAPTVDQQGPAPEQVKHKAEAVKAPEPQREPLLRLEIKHDEEGRYVYTLTDRNTGRTVVEIPREALDRLGTEPTYTAGDVVSTKA